MTKSKTSTRSQTMTHAIPRRDCLRALGVAVLGAPVLGAAAVASTADDLKTVGPGEFFLPRPAAVASAADDAKTKAKKNLKLGIMSGVYAGLKLEEAAQRIKADGFSSVVTDYTFADVRFDPQAPDWEAAKKIVAAFDRQGIRIAGIFGYYNVVDPDPEKRKRGEARMELLIANWKRLGCPNISTETGTLNPKSDWLTTPENATEKAYLECRAALQKLAKAAEKTGAIISIEPYWQNVIDSIERTARLLREVPSPALRLVMDPCNYYRKTDLPRPRVRQMLEEMFRRLGDKIVIAHAKDVKASADGTDLPAAGRGVLDYPLYLRLLAGLGREMDLIIEHLTLDDVARSRDFVLGEMERI
jgi:sugar phosphate isomerase/epimerase